MPDIQWFPGHMAKTGRELRESVKLADLVIEVVDARIPRSSVNPDFDEIFAGRRRLMVLNKTDLADPARSLLWKNHFRGLGYEALFTNAKKGEGVKQIRGLLLKAGRDKSQKQAGKGVIGRPLRAVVAGIPNSGKSQLINCLASKASAKTGDKPGVTRHRQWIKLDGGVELLDTPGVLWPKFDSAEVALHLAFTGAIRDDVYDTAEVAEKLLSALCKDYLQLGTKRYGEINAAGAPGVADFSGVASVSGVSGVAGSFDASGVSSALGVPGAVDVSDVAGAQGAYPLLESVGRRRGFLIRGGAVDVGRAAALILDEFRAAKIGAITLEVP
jgi:ribosome biogenesis GTPase A